MKTDWRLPTKDELNKMYKNLYRKGVGGFAVGFYWSSSEYNSTTAWGQYFSSGDQYANGDQYTYLKDYERRVRCVRSFVRAFADSTIYKLGVRGPLNGWIFDIQDGRYFECAAHDLKIGSEEYFTWIDLVEKDKITEPSKHKDVVKMEYFLAIDNGSEGWSLCEYETLNEIEDAILSGGTYGCNFKILKELKLKIKE